MSLIETRVDCVSAAFAERRERMLARVAEVRALEAKVVAASEQRRERFEQRGQLLPRERVARLLDRDSGFLELSSLAGLGMHDDDGVEAVMGGGSIAGIGRVAGKRVLIAASDSGIKGGTVPPMGLKKALRVQAIALENKLPLIHLVESGGANLMYQAEMFVDGGRSFANQARLSAAGIPQIAVVHGASTAGGAYLPALADYCVLVRGRSSIYLAGPPLVKAAIGEEATEEELGGSALHTHTTGLGDYLADDDAHAIALTRELLASLPWDAAPRSGTFKPPRFDAEELLGLAPIDEREPLDPREIIARLVDGSEWLEFKAGYGADTVCGHARIEGHAIGLLANHGAIQPQGSTKAAQFIQLCEQAGTPLVFLQNTTGYMVGKEAEAQGAIKHGAKMIQAVANATVPKITIQIGASFGAGNYGMCGRGFDPRFLFTWPNARTAVMGGAQAAQVMDTVNRAKAQRAGLPAPEAALAAISAPLRERIERESSVLYGTARLWDDGIIDPRDTRRVLALCLALAAESAQRVLRPNSFGVARF